MSTTNQDRPSVRLYLSNRTATFEAERRGVALAFRLVIRARGRSCHQGGNKRGEDGCRGKKENPDQNIDVQKANFDVRRTKIKW